MNYLGIDLGTANTYIYGCDSLRDLPKAVLVPELGDQHGSISTTVLYEEGKPVLAGNVAEAEYYSQPGLQAKRKLAAQFKPEIGLGNPEALKYASDFLALVKKALPENILQPTTCVSVGIPALAREDFRLNLRQCFLAAGWPAPAFARESDAALVSCLQSGSLTVEDIRKKCLIMDFGGGTCDYTALTDLDILQNGGDILYGGRLFDDLFFQAFCRENGEFAKEIGQSPYAWHAHWLACREQKEKFSDFISSPGNRDKTVSLAITWFDRHGKPQNAFLHDYGLEKFLRDAENYTADADLLRLLEPYANRGGLSRHARDLAAGRAIGLIDWLSDIFARIENRREINKAILTGGSCRWYFVHDLARERFPAAAILASAREYEDIAFGLALFPLLEESGKKAAAILKEKLPSYINGAIKDATALIHSQSGRIVHLCSRRIVERDIMPALEDAQKRSISVKDLERKFAENMEKDEGLKKIAREGSEILTKRLQEEVNVSFAYWLKENGVPLAPKFNFHTQAIGDNFFNSVSIKISRLDSLNLMSFTIKNIFPILAGTTAAGAIAHTGEPISTVIGGGLTFGASWLLARAAPSFFENRNLPRFILTEKNRKKIAEKNREHIEKALSQSLDETCRSMAVEIETRLTSSLESMLASLTALNQVRLK